MLITISTSGLVPEIQRFGQEEIKANLAISLNGVTEESRKALMPMVFQVMETLERRIGTFNPREA